MERLKKFMTHMGAYPAALVKWMTVGGLIGGVGGVIGSLFHIGVHYATWARGAHPWILYLLPVLGLVIAVAGGSLIERLHLDDQVEAFIRSGRAIDVPQEELHFKDRIQYDPSGRWQRRPGGRGATDRRRHWLHHRTAAAFRGEGFAPGDPVRHERRVRSAVRHAADGGGLRHGGHQRWRVLLRRTYPLPDGGALVSLVMGVPPTRFTVADPGMDPWTMLLVIFLAIGCAVVSILFCRGIQETGSLAARLLPNPFLRVAVGGALIVGLTLLVGNTDYNGAGMEVVERAMGGQVDGWAWILKLLFTAVTIGFGFKGGEVVPSFFVGACFGCLLGGFLGLPAGFGAAIGLVAVFCGAVNCPIASVFLSIELFGTGDLLYFAMACAISYLLSGYCGLYSSQTILYSKMRAEFINIHTNENEEHHG